MNSKNKEHARSKIRKLVGKEFVIKGGRILGEKEVWEEGNHLDKSHLEGVTYK